jgi:integrase
MASIHRNPRSPKGVWYAHYTLADGRRVARSTGTRDRSQAKIITEAWAAAETAAAYGELSQTRVLAILNETLQRIGANPVQYVSVRQWLTDWLASKDNQTAKATRSAYGQAVADFLSYLGDRGAARRLDSITTADIEGFVRGLRKEGRSASTINKIRAFLSQPFEKARKGGTIRFNPCSLVQPEKAEPIVKGTFTAEQVAALVAVADPDWAGAILFAWGSGARLGDVANLRWSALDMANGIVTFRERKTGATAIIGLHPDFADWLTERPAPEAVDAFVFPTLAGRSINSSLGLSAQFATLMDRAGIENRLLRAGNAGKGRTVPALSFHSLRHSAASNVFNSAAIKEVARRVTNHSAGGSLDQYLHQDLEAIRAAVGLIPRLPRANG